MRNCRDFQTITKAEYDRLKEIPPIEGDAIYCKRDDGTVYLAKWQEDLGYSHSVNCRTSERITKAEYDRLKGKKTDTATTSKTETESSNDDPLEAKLEKLKKLLEKGLITEEEAAAKRAKLLEDL